MTLTIDKDEAITLLREAVEGNEDFVYASPAKVALQAAQAEAEKQGEFLDEDDWEGMGDYFLDNCYYIHPGNVPGCIVGHALVNAGVSVDILREINDTAIRANSAMNHLANNGVIVTRDAQAILSVAQNAQDCGEHWGAALAKAERRLVATE